MADSWIDPHCHLDDPKFEPDRAEVIERARSAGAEALICVGCDVDTSRAAIALAETCDLIWATVGLHPHDARLFDPPAATALAELAARPRVVAWGEIGLDYHYDNSPRDRQRQAFADQLELARTAGLPVVVHTREAWDDTFSILAAAALPAIRGDYAGVIHCFSGEMEQARRAIDLGYAVSFAGPVTYPAATSLRDTASRVPLEYLLAETDAPYLAPVPHRGRRNEPAFVLATIGQIAAGRGQPVQQVAAAVRDNARRLFGLPAPVKGAP